MKNVIMVAVMVLIIVALSAGIFWLMGQVKEQKASLTPAKASIVVVDSTKQAPAPVPAPVTKK